MNHHYVLYNRYCIIRKVKPFRYIFQVLTSSFMSFYGDKKKIIFEKHKSSITEFQAIH